MPTTREHRDRIIGGISTSGIIVRHRHVTPLIVTTVQAVLICPGEGYFRALVTEL